MHYSLVFLPLTPNNTFLSIVAFSMCINVIFFEIIFDINMSGFKTLNVRYAETTCPIDFKLTGSIVQFNRNLYTDFQVILKFYKNI